MRCAEFLAPTGLNTFSQFLQPALSDTCAGFSTYAAPAIRAELQPVDLRAQAGFSWSSAG